MTAHLGLVRVGNEVHRASHTAYQLSGDRVARLAESRVSLASEERNEDRTRSPAALTSIAPRIETSTCPPRIMPKLSTLSKTLAPGTSVTVSLPAFTRSLERRHQRPEKVYDRQRNVNNSPIDLVKCREGAHTEDAVLALHASVSPHEKRKRMVERTCSQTLTSGFK